MPPSSEELEAAFFRQVAEAYDTALRTTVAAVTAEPGTDEYFEARVALASLRDRLQDPEGVRAFEEVLSEALRSLAHSFFAILDGASLSEEERVIAVGLQGQELRQGLHEHWVEFLFDTGRLT